MLDVARTGHHSPIGQIDSSGQIALFLLSDEEFGTSLGKDCNNTALDHG